MTHCRSGKEIKRYKKLQGRLSNPVVEVKKEEEVEELASQPIEHRKKEIFTEVGD